MTYDCFTIERYGDEFLVAGHGTYERSSVLAGQPRRQVLDFYPTLDEAQEAYPEADVLAFNTQSVARVPDVAFGGFDPADAGERWDADY